MNPLPLAWTRLESHISNDKLAWPSNVAARSLFHSDIGPGRKILGSRCLIHRGKLRVFDAVANLHVRPRGEDCVLRTFSANCERKNSESPQTARSRDQKLAREKSARRRRSGKNTSGRRPSVLDEFRKAIWADRPILRAAILCGLARHGGPKAPLLAACIVFCGHRRGSFQRPVQYALSIR